MFGDLADEAFMAWEYGLFANQVVKAGKAEYALPMYMNAQLPAPFEHGGEYPSGGPYPLVQSVYRAAAPAVDFYAPDIYWPDFAAWVDRYHGAGNPAFVPEARLDQAPGNALYLYGEARGFGFSPFSVDSIPADPPQKDDAPEIADVYAALNSMTDEIVQAQQKNQIRGLVLHANSPRPSQTVGLGGFLFRATLSRTWPARQLATQDGAMMVLSTAPNEFIVVGSGLTVTILRDPDTDDQAAQIAGVEQGRAPMATGQPNASSTATRPTRGARCRWMPTPSACIASGSSFIPGADQAGLSTAAEAWVPCCAPRWKTRAAAPRSLAISPSSAGRIVGGPPASVSSMASFSITGPKRCHADVTSPAIRMVLGDNPAMIIRSPRPIPWACIVSAWAAAASPSSARFSSS